MESLPLSKRALNARDLTVLPLLSSPLWVLTVVAFVAAKLANPGREAIVLIDMLLGITGAQLSTVRRAGWAGLSSVIIFVLAGCVHRADALVLLGLASGLLLWTMPLGSPRHASDYRQAGGFARFRRGAIGWVELHWQSAYLSANCAYRVGLMVSVALTLLFGGCFISMAPAQFMSLACYSSTEHYSVACSA